MNKIWHTAEERPVFPNEILYFVRKTPFMFNATELVWESHIKEGVVKKWAYVKDLEKLDVIGYKAKAYDEAFEKAKKLKNSPEEVFYEFTPKEGDTICDYIFPELKESKEEWIEKLRDEIIAFLGNRQITSISESDAINVWIAWLEKQGKEPKKVSIWKHWKDGIAGGAEGEQIFLTKIGRIYSISSCLGCECDYIELSELDKLTREDKPKWTEEDEENLRDIISAIQFIPYQTAEAEEERTDWLKSLKQRMGG